MQAVKYARASSVDEAIQLLRDGGDRARPLAGGTDIIVQARERAIEIDTFVDIKHIPELMAIEHASDGGLTIGAGVPCYEIYGDDQIVSAFPALVQATQVIGGTAIQGRASLGGNLCNSSPAGDTIPAMIALYAVADIAGPNGERQVAVEDFCTGVRQNVLESGEFVTSISFPAPAAGSGAAWERFIPRNEMDIAVTNAGSSLTIEGGTVTAARVSIGAVAPTVLLVAAAADALVGQALSDETIDAAGSAARDAATPIDDMRGSIRQRKHLAKVLTERTLRAAGERAGA